MITEWVWFPLDRKTYRLKTTQEFLAHIKDRYKDPYIIPEGGNNWLGVAGAAEIVDLLPPVKRMKRIILLLAELVQLLVDLF
ncbi:MAG: hypothetical protein CM1200mP40_20990 [Gammaproteobacteria bacterium]|nr:MAG: hypothetical protein CM1200mP40_20990 [Gammaproteobacteria bacterium]